MYWSTWCSFISFALLEILCPTVATQSSKRSEPWLSDFFVNKSTASADTASGGQLHLDGKVSQSNTSINENGLRTIRENIVDEYDDILGAVSSKTGPGSGISSATSPSQLDETLHSSQTSLKDEDSWQTQTQTMYEVTTEITTDSPQNATETPSELIARSAKSGKRSKTISKRVESKKSKPVDDFDVYPSDPDQPEDIWPNITIAGNATAIDTNSTTSPLNITVGLMVISSNMSVPLPTKEPKRAAGARPRTSIAHLDQLVIATGSIFLAVLALVMTSFGCFELRRWHASREPREQWREAYARQSALLAEEATTSTSLRPEWDEPDNPVR